MGAPGAASGRPVMAPRGQQRAFAAWSGPHVRSRDLFDWLVCARACVRGGRAGALLPAAKGRGFRQQGGRQPPKIRPRCVVDRAALDLMRAWPDGARAFDAAGERHASGPALCAQQATGLPAAVYRPPVAIVYMGHAYLCVACTSASSHSCCERCLGFFSGQLQASAGMERMQGLNWCQDRCS